MLNKLLDFYKTQMTEEQLKQASTLFNDDDKLLYFVICHLELRMRTV